jgi:hypothetical protein
MKKSITLFTLSLLSSTAIADCLTNICTDVYVQQIYIRSGGENLIQTSGDETKLTCQADSNIFLSIPQDGNQKDMLSVLLAAQMANKKVSIRLGNTGSCKVAYMYINRQ